MADAQLESSKMKRIFCGNLCRKKNPPFQTFFDTFRVGHFQLANYQTPAYNDIHLKTYYLFYECWQAKDNLWYRTVATISLARHIFNV